MQFIESLDNRFNLQSEEAADLIYVLEKKPCKVKREALLCAKHSTTAAAL